MTLAYQVSWIIGNQLHAQQYVHLPMRRAEVGGRKRASVAVPDESKVCAS
jgi:hypothetical protein